MSWILPRAEAKLTAILSRFAIVEDNLLEAAPSSPRRVDTVDIAASSVPIAVRALLAVVTPTSALIAEVSKSLKITVSVLAVSYTHLTLPTISCV